MSEYVSSCCGSEYKEVYSEMFKEEKILCCECNEYCEPIEDYEYSEQMKEARDEDRADEARDMGE
tara:strand:+ start:148 stop:342 length:195 start_codon:yes stop_codon:yes gene_type:complete